MSAKSFQHKIVRFATGFSLIELLVTMACMALLLSASVPAFINSRRAAALTQAGNALADLTALARQTALSKNTITALIITPKATVSTKQALLVAEYDSAGEMWKPLSGWVRISDDATVVDMGTSVQAAGNAKARSLAPLNIKFNGSTLQSLNDTEYSVLIFYPDGRMENGAESTRQLSARFSTAGTTAASDSLSNYYDLVVNSNTSAFRIVRR